MKIVLDVEEMNGLVGQIFPLHLFPSGYSVENVEAKGYPTREFEITLKYDEKRFVPLVK